MNSLESLVEVGVDEVGRGSLFGPVFAGAIILNKIDEAILIDKGLKDSKKISPKKRDVLANLIHRNNRNFGLGQASHKEIDEIGIRGATELAMIRALQKINQPYDMVLIDGILPIRGWQGKQQTIVKGDSLYPCISAASVLAKVARDSLIKRIAIKFPEYELERNFGYGTAFHRKALIRIGSSKLHRESFLTKIIKH